MKPLRLDLEIAMADFKIFLDGLQVAHWNRMNFTFSAPPTMTYEEGRKYARIVIEGTQRSCFGFIDMTNGDILKSAGWKAPAKNFSRGNLFDKESWKADWTHGIH
jgi:hypothetical protein